VTTLRLAICCGKSVCLSVVCDVRAPYSWGIFFLDIFAPYCSLAIRQLSELTHQKWRRSFKRITPKGGVKCKGYEKVAISYQYLAIARKRLKIDGYMLRCVWHALNPLSIHVKFTAIVPWAYPGEAKMCQTGESGISPILLIYYTAARL